jgi:peroxiredoxin
MLGFGNYNYEHFTREHLQEIERAAFSGPEPGERPSDFSARTLDDTTIRLSDYEGKKNVLLIFGSATCPMTAGSVPGINQLYDQFHGKDLEFLFVYVREAHPGERVPAHKSMKDKARAAQLLRDKEDLEMPVLVDDLHGGIHRKYSRLPNAAYLIDKSGRVAFRSLWAQSEALAAAVLELRDRGASVVRGGQDLSMPVSYSALYSFRALERGGHQSLHDFRQALGRPGRGGAAASSTKSLGHPGRVLAMSAVAAVVVAGGMYAGFELRRRRLGGGGRINPYRAYEKDKVAGTDTDLDYGAVGI